MMVSVHSFHDEADVILYFDYCQQEGEDQKQQCVSPFLNTFQTFLPYLQWWNETLHSFKCIFEELVLYLAV